MSKRESAINIAKFEMITHLSTTIINDVKTAIDNIKPTIALYVGGMGAKDKNYHKKAMEDRGFGKEATRIQELFLAGRKDEAITMLPDNYIDDSNLIGPAKRIQQRLTYGTMLDSLN